MYEQYTERHIETTQTPLPYNVGSGHETLKMIYQALIKSNLDYDNEIYESTNKNSSISLTLVGNKALGVDNGAFRCSPIIDTLEII